MYFSYALMHACLGNQIGTTAQACQQGSWGMSILENKSYIQ